MADPSFIAFNRRSRWQLELPRAATSINCRAVSLALGPADATMRKARADDVVFSGVVHETSHPPSGGGPPTARRGPLTTPSASNALATSLVGTRRDKEMDVVDVTVGAIVDTTVGAIGARPRPCRCPRRASDAKSPKPAFAPTFAHAFGPTLRNGTAVVFF